MGNYDFRIENLVISNQQLSLKDFAIIIDAVFGAYRASGKSLEESWDAARKDSSWLFPQLLSLVEDVSEDLNKASRQK